MVKVFGVWPGLAKLKLTVTGVVIGSGAVKIKVKTKGSLKSNAALTIGVVVDQCLK